MSTLFTRVGLQKDGNLKVMFETECRSPQAVPQLYGCVGKTVFNAHAQCAALFEQFNRTRHRTAARIGPLFRGVEQRVERLLAGVAEDSDMVDQVVALA